MPVIDNHQKKSDKLETHLIIRYGILFLGFWLFAVIISRIIYPFDLGHLEAFNLMPAAHLLAGRNPYAFAFTPPYSMSPYGIIFYAFLAVGLKFFGFQMWFGRILSVLAFAVCSLLVIKITKKLTSSAEAGLAAGLVCLVMFPGQFWVAIMRSDFIGIALGLTAVWWIFRFTENEKINFRSIMAIGFLGCAAFFTKQSFFLPIFIIVLRLFQLRKWREAGYFITECLILMTALMFFLNYTSDGDYIWQQFTHSKTLPFSSNQLLSSVIGLLELPTVMIFCVFLFVFAYLNRQIFNKPPSENLLFIRRSPKFLIFLYFLISFIWSTIAVARVGANINYYLECSFLMAIICGVIYDYLHRNSFLRSASVFLILLILGGAFQLLRISRGEYFRWQALNYYQEISDTAGRMTPPNSICVSIYDELVTRNGCAFNFDDIGEYTSDWSASELREIFIREVKAGRYAVIILPTDTFHETFPNYRLVPMSQPPPEKFYKVFLYVPNTAPPQ